MSRVLTVARSWVAADDEAEYLRTLGKLSRRLAARGQHLWVFRSRHHPDRFLECAEGSETLPPRQAMLATEGGGTAESDDAELESTLRDLAQYDDTSDEPWDEVRFG